jgi:uncharacterized membrane protein
VAGNSPDRTERALACGAAILLGLVCVAIVRGHAQWFQVPALVWFHIAAVIVVLALTPVLLWQRRGTRRHRTLGWIWASGMVLLAAESFWVRTLRAGQLSAIHVLSVVVLVSVPLAVMAARRHKVARHRRGMRALVIGALLIAGFFAFPFRRLLGVWLVG